MNEFKIENYFNTNSFEHSDIFADIRNAWEVLPKIKVYIESLFREGKIKGNYKENVYVREGTIIHPQAEIIGPAIIGKNCVISYGSYLREYCLLGDNVHIGHGAEVKNSLFLNGAVSAHLNYIGDSIVGAGVNIAGGAMFANFRFDKQNVSVKFNGEKIDTGLVKFCAIVGDDSNIGANAVLNPGTLLGKNTIVYPLSVVSGVHKNSEVIRNDIK